jgi:PAS domain S-box-containing protein
VRSRREASAYSYNDLYTSRLSSLRMTSPDRPESRISIPQAQDAQFRVFVDSVRDYALIMLDPSGYIVSWNSGAAAIKGYTSDEIVGRHFTRFYPQEALDRGLPQRELVVARETGRFEDEGWRIRKDGSRFWANVVITALRDSTGELIGFAKVTRDLTERRKAEESMRTSEARFRALIQGVRDYAIFMLDPEGRVATWNEGAEHIKGYTAEEIIGSHFSKFYPNDALERGMPQHELTTAMTEGRFEDEGWRLRKDGSHFWANVVLTAIRDANGQLVGFSKITRDLTERRRHENALKASEERFRLLVEGMIDYAIITIDQEGFITSWNNGATQMYDYSRADIVGKHFSRLYPQEEILANKPWEDLIAAGRAGRSASEGWRIRRDGTRYWTNNIIAALRETDGSTRSYYMVSQDLTQRRQAESLADAAQRTNEFIAMLAHELRNPLAPIRNAVALMERKGMGDPVLESMRQTIDRQSVLLTRIVDELLDVNRMARGHFSIERQTIDLREVLARAVETSRPLLEQRRHTFEMELPEELPALTGDVMRLVQVFVNLLNNAAKYTAAHGLVRLEAQLEENEVIVRVRDTGRGIPAESLERVFDLFMQVAPETGGEQGGLGVGLALVRRIVELHGGRVFARSEGAGKGSEFSVHLPRATRDVELSPKPTVQPGIRQLRVLVVDDNRDAADSLRVLLENAHQEVRTAYDGAGALDAARSFLPQLVLLDIGMPRMDGYEVARRLRALPLTPRPMLVALTGWGQASDKRRASAAGFDRHFTKPVCPEELLGFVGALSSQLDS